MKKNLKSKNKAGSAPRIDPYLEGLMGKLLEHLVSVEKKLDTVVAQTTGKPSGNGDQTKPFQKPEPIQSPRRDRILYEAICADCHKVCEVPFKPSEDRPVYCKECFAKRKSQPNGRQTAGPGKSHAVLTPVALPPKPVSKLGIPAVSIPPKSEAPKKVKKNQPSKKAKKRK